MMQNEPQKRPLSIPPGSRRDEDVPGLAVGPHDVQLVAAGPTLRPFLHLLAHAPVGLRAEEIPQAASLEHAARHAEDRLRRRVGERDPERLVQDDDPFAEALHQRAVALLALQERGLRGLSLRDVEDADEHVRVGIVLRGGVHHELDCE